MKILEEDLQLLKCISMLAKISDEHLKLLAYVSQRIIFEKEETILREGEQGDDAYIICQGTARVFKNIRGESVLINTLAEGDVFGELAIISNCPRSATVVAETDMVVLRIEKDVFLNLMAQYPREVGLQVMHAIVNRLFQAEKKLYGGNQSFGGNEYEGER
ncbi:MAG: cyclic nucleotide-binding domain-containing protein [Deltaproteobacteria bacterium]|nr:cyclic nucleotide-binding domain-containing protein [Deltaproteobacteria bacterium]MBW2306623.1 cyclic nucleotide-binding domain-containing protein [Deltaproteobacteria bacterium]